MKERVMGGITRTNKCDEIKTTGACGKYIKFIVKFSSNCIRYSEVNKNKNKTNYNVFYKMLTARN